MSGSSGLAGGLNYLPVWFGDATDGGLDAALCGWVSASGWQSAGLVLPAGDGQRCVVASTTRAERSAQPPAEQLEVARSLKAGAATVVWQRPGTSGRLYTAVCPAGRPAGQVWAERSAGEPWGEADRAALGLAARLIERSPLLAELVGPVADPVRLSQRLNDAATVCGRMAHDFDNVLTGIIGFTELTTPLLQPGTQPAKYLAEIGKVGQRGVQFTQQLHQLSRSGQARPQPASLAAAVAKEEARLRVSHPAAEVVANVPANLALVAADAGPLAVVLGHLLDNAVQATPAAGPVTVTARACELSGFDARGYLGAAAAGPHVEVTVSDCGPGIKPDLRPKLFHEPFTTTRAGRRGLGLAVVLRTLTAHRGGIRLDAADPGTVARFVLPVAAARPPVATHLQPALGADRR